MKGHFSIFLQKINVKNSIKREMKFNFFYTKIYFVLNVGNSINARKPEIYTKIYKTKKFLILFCSIFKKLIQNSNNIPSISKTIQHTAMVHMDGQTDGRKGGGRCNISRPWDYGAAGDNKATWSPRINS